MYLWCAYAGAGSGENKADNRTTIASRPDDPHRQGRKFAQAAELIGSYQVLGPAQHFQMERLNGAPLTGAVNPLPAQCELVPNSSRVRSTSWISVYHLSLSRTARTTLLVNAACV